MNFKADDFVCKVCYPSSSEVAASKAPASTKPVKKNGTKYFDNAFKI